MPVHPQESRRLPEGTRLLHVGLPQAGTRSLQVALRTRAEQLAEHGTLAPAAGPGSVRALVTGRGGADATAITRDLTQAGDVQRVVLSDELLAAAPDDQLRDVRGLLGPRTHVLVCLRAPAALLPAVWQQRLRRGEAAPLAQWAGDVLDDPSSLPFLGLEDGGVVARWCATLGAENVTVVVDDPAEPARLHRVVEDLLGLPAGLLPAEPAVRGLTPAETAVVADVWARRAAEEEPAPADLTTRLLDGATARLLSDVDPGPDALRPVLDAALTARAAELGRATALAVRATGAHVVGDLDALAGPEAGRLVPQTSEPAPVQDPGAAPELDLEAAAALLHGMFVAGREAVEAAERRGRVQPSTARARALPAGTRILHVGAPVTGAVVAQEAFAATRGAQARTARRAVAYPGTARGHDALVAAANRADETGPSLQDVLAGWASEMPAGTTTVLAAERLALLDAEQAARVVEALRSTAGEPVHVVVTLRSVPEMLVAAWQEHVANGGVQTFESWLRHALDDDAVVRMGGVDAFREDDGSNLVARWAAAAGPGAVTVVVERAEGRDTLAVLASLAGIPPRTVPPGPAARALTAPETEMFRAFNATLPYRGTVPAAQRRRYVHRGAVAALQATPAPDEAAVVLPSWAATRARAAGRRLADQVREQVTESGVVVVGPLAALAALSAGSSEGADVGSGESSNAGSGEGLHRSSVETALLGLFDRAVRMPEPVVPEPPAPAAPVAPAPPTAAPAPPAPVRLADLPGRAVLGELRRRVLRGRVRPRDDAPTPHDAPRGEEAGA
ncbi:hypothetical protein KIN34_09885 [Cellulomonas sp. DKR-3]|uniref:Uncharacterized protein n=1 Tax=Cellulomonas fulva TaxID=2835530 RepID=A0ABS5TZR2_9CELL|nr:hypothetical protein [Cellulomonas fulva]MBT0994596.1 hypothetical protein [Cellulomonas fulva]